MTMDGSAVSATTAGADAVTVVAADTDDEEETVLKTDTGNEDDEDDETSTTTTTTTTKTTTTTTMVLRLTWSERASVLAFLVMLMWMTLNLLLLHNSYTMPANDVLPVLGTRL